MSSFIQSLSLDSLDVVALLVNVSIKVVIALALAAVVCRLLHRKSAAVRHRVWAIAVVVSLLMPLAVGFMPHLTIAQLPEQLAARVESSEAPTLASKTAPIFTAPRETAALTPSTLVAQPSVFTETGSDMLANSLALPLAATAANNAGRPVFTSQLILLSLWGIGVCVVAAPFLWMLLVQWSRKRRLELIQDNLWNASVAALSRKLKLGRSVKTFESARGTVPAVFGVLRPYLVVPDNWRDWSDEQRTCILLHELAHVKRFDVATQFLGRLAMMVYWFNPLAWCAVRRLRIERELACDDCVLTSGQRASDYAEQLLRTLKLYRMERFTPGVAMAHSARLDQRVLAILDQTRCRLPMSRTMVGVGVLCAVSMTAVLGAASFAAPSVEEGSDQTTANSPAKEATLQQSPSDPNDPKFAGHFSGRVTGPDGEPVRDARLFVVPVSNWKATKEAGPVRAMTDADGRFEFDAPDMTYTNLDSLPARRKGLLMATAEGFAPDWMYTWGQNISSLRSHLTPIKSAAMNLQLGADDAPIHGRFLDLDGRPLAEARVRLTSLMIPRKQDLDWHLEHEENVTLRATADYERSLYQPHLVPGLITETQTDADGRFTISGTGRDRLAVLDISAPSVVDTNLRVMTRDAPDVGTHLDFNGKPTGILYGAGFTLQLKRGRTINGRVVDRDTGEPIPGMRVGPLVNPVVRFTPALYPHITDEQGRFAITGLRPNQDEQVIVAVAGASLPYQTAWVEVEGGDNSEIVIECMRGIPYRLKLVDEQGTLVVEAEVSYVDVQPNPHNPKVRDEVHWPINRVGNSTDGIYEGFVLPGPGALLVKTPSRRYRSALVDPKAFFAPGRADWTAQEQISAYGTTDKLTTSNGRYLDTLWRSSTAKQNDYEAIVLVNPPPDSGPLELSATVVRDTPRQVSLIDPDGQPVVGVEVTFDNGYTTKLRATSFPMTRLHPDRLRRITFTKEDRQLIGFLLARGDGDAPYTVRMQPWAAITGRIVDETGKALYENGSIGVVINGEPEGTNPLYGKTDWDGRFRIDKLVPGHRYSVQTYRQPGGDWIKTAFEKLVLGAGEVRDLGNIIRTKPSPALAEDMQKYLRDTQVLVRKGEHEKALDRFLWFHDHALEHAPSMSGVRLSFALSYWKQLGDVYPPALTALKKTRDDKTTLLAQGNSNSNLFHDVMALNRTLGDDGKTVELFRMLDQDHKDLAKQCWVFAKAAIIKAKAYDLARKYIGDPVREFGKVKELYDMKKAMYGRKNFGDHFKAFNEDNFVEETLRLIDVAIALDNAKAAREIQAKALVILDDHRLRDAVDEDKEEGAPQTLPQV